jgi:uncharacterized coiled-coil protein SlyX
MADIMDDIMAGSHFMDQEEESNSANSDDEVADETGFVESCQPGMGATNAVEAKLASQEQVIQRLQAECAEWAAQTEAAVAKMEVLEARLADVDAMADLPGTPGNAREVCVCVCVCVCVR